MSARLGSALDKRDDTPSISAELKRASGSIAAALPDGFPGGPERFARIVLTAVRLTPGLKDCTPLSIIGSAMQAAQLGLTPGTLGECWLIPYKNQGVSEASFQIGWKGVLVLASRAGYRLSGATVREHDLFDYELGTDSYIKHRPNRDAEGKSLYWYCIARERTSNDVATFAVLNRPMVERRRKVSKSPNSPAWTNFYDEMALGKAAREACRFVPMSVEMADAFHSEERVRTSIEGDASEFTGYDEDVIEVHDAQDTAADVPADTGAKP